MLTWQQIYESQHQFSGGVVTIAVPFTGNTLAIECSTKPEYALTKQVIGYIQQFSGDAQKGYALYSGKDIVQLSLPETDSLIFVPTNFLSDNYTLSIASTTIGAISGENSEPIPPLILGLPNRVNTLEADLYELDTTVGSQGTAITALQNSVNASSWDDITGKPNSFPPSSHNHAIGEITNLAGFLATYALKNEVPSSLLGANAAIGALQTSDTEQNIAIGTLQTNVSNLGNSSASLAYTLLSTNQALESNKKYLASVTGLVCSLPPSPAIGDVISLSTGNFDLRVTHGNASQRILNLGTLTTMGSGSGVLLKSNADIDLVFIGGELWKSMYRSRIINNWLDAALDSNIIQHSYVPTALEPYTYADPPYVLQAINDGSDTIGVMKTGGGTNVKFIVRATFPFSTILKRIRCNGGQFNGNFHMPLSVNIYRGGQVLGSDLIANITQLNGVNNNALIDITNSEFSTQYTFDFTSTSNPQLSIRELRLFGQQILGGEIVAV